MCDSVMRFDVCIVRCRCLFAVGAKLVRMSYVYNPGKNGMSFMVHGLQTTMAERRESDTYILFNLSLFLVLLAHPRISISANNRSKFNF